MGEGGKMGKSKMKAKGKDDGGRKGKEEGKEMREFKKDAGLGGSAFRSRADSHTISGPRRRVRIDLLRSFWGILPS